MEQDLYEAIILSACKQYNCIELAIGHIRYEYIRTLSPRQFQELSNVCLHSGVKFDDEVDSRIVAWYNSKHKS